VWIGARSKLSIIPQDPFLFSGTVRDNIDPQHLRSDMEISDAVRQCRLVQTVDRLGGLDGVVTEGGRMLSAGERQLVCLARALLSQTQVFLVLFLFTLYFFLDQELISCRYSFCSSCWSTILKKPKALSFQIESE